jgi:3-isopropylmalate dehydrogenase
MNKKSIAVLAGDGVGPEVMREALSVVRKVCEVYGREVATTDALVGGAAFEEYGIHLPEQTIEVCRAADAILFGSVGGPIVEAPKVEGV